jgi:hypothetical protein
MSDQGREEPAKPAEPAQPAQPPPARPPEQGIPTGVEINSIRPNETSRTEPVEEVR